MFCVHIPWSSCHIKHSSLVFRSLGCVWGGGRKTLQERDGSGSDTDLAHFPAMLPTHCYYKTYYGTVPPIDFLTCSRWQRSGNVGSARQRSLCRRSALALATEAWSCLCILSVILFTRTKVLYQ